MSETLILNGKDLTLEDLYSVVYDRRPVQIDPEVIPLVDKSRQVLFDMAADGKPVYGLNHGVGWNKDREFSQDFFEQYNRNLINSHSLGVAPFASVEEVRAMMCIRLNTALCGRTGIASNILKMYEEFLNRGIHPRAMRRGAVGEGDVSTMSMIGQAMIGQGEVEYHGEIIPAIDAMRAEGIEPAILGPKDGLSIVSSNAQGESMVVLLVKEVEELIKLSDAIYCLPLGERVNEVRGLPGQIHCAAECRRFLEGSYLEHPDSKRALQDPLSFRCGAAINGSVYDSLEYVKKILELQINRTDDNPCILYEEGTTSVSPNFEVTTLSLGVDMLAAALCHMSHAITNRLYKIVDPGFTGLNRFLTPHEVKTIAFSTIQKTFAALDAENRWLANNLPLAGMRSLRIVDNLRYMLGMELMHAAQAVEMRRDQRADNLLKLGKVTGPLKDAYRKTIPYYDADRNLSIDIEKSYQVIKNGSRSSKRPSARNIQSQMKKDASDRMRPFSMLFFALQAAHQLGEGIRRQAAGGLSLIEAVCRAAVVVDGLGDHRRDLFDELFIEHAAAHILLCVRHADRRAADRAERQSRLFDLTIFVEPDGGGQSLAGDGHALARTDLMERADKALKLL